MARAEAHERAARTRVQMRRSLAEEVGQEEESAGAWSSRVGELRQRFMHDRRRECLSPPFEGSAGGQCHAHQVIAARDAMTERVHPSQLVRREPRAWHEEHSAGADRRDADARCDHPDANCSGCVIARPRRDRHLRSETQLGGERRLDIAGLLRALHDRRQPSGRDLQQPEELVRPGPASEVEQEGA